MYNRGAGGVSRAMAPGGASNMDIRSILGTIVNFCKSKANSVCAAPCDGLVLRMYYRWTFFIFVGGFFAVWYSWYHRDVITCVSHYNADTQVRLDYINICLSYPYIEGENEDRRYLLFYRWIHWSFLLLAAIFYIPRKLSKNWDNARVKKLLEDLATYSFKYDQSEKDLLDRAIRYVSFNMKTHNGLYWKFLTVNCIALLINVFTFQLIDFILQGRFIRYGFEAYPFDRDPKEFTDYMSVTFPPFATCEIDKTHKLVAKRAEILGCHLTFMELYEKLFLAIWLWLIILAFITAAYIVFLLLLMIPAFRLHLLKCEKPINGSGKVADLIAALSRTCKIGDVYLLYRIKSHLSHARFYELLATLANPHYRNEMYPENRQQGDSQRKGMPQKQHPDSLRNRKPMQQMQQQMVQEPPINPAFLQQLLSNPEISKKQLQQQQQHDMQQRTPLLDKNTSILIE